MTSSDDASKTGGWHTIDWFKANQTVKRLQIRIVKAIQAGKHRKVKSLQWLLTHSFSAKTLAVKRVTENAGKKTAGVDGQLWNSPSQKFAAIASLRLSGYKPSPLKRVCIPKGNTGKVRKLGIPTLKDRAMQALHLLALEPVAETTADENSYGFRPQRSCADAIEQVFIALGQKRSAEWILEADIKSCFDQISHQWIMQHIPIHKRILGQWLKMGVIEGKRFLPTQAGVPQGGICSPTIANMVLDGLEKYIETRFGVKYRKDGTKDAKKNKIHFIRYADDFVVTAKSEDILIEVKQCIAEFLQQRGLELSHTKTKITHIRKGFDFLGQNVRKYQDKLLIKPSKKSIQSIKAKIKQTISANKMAKTAHLIWQLNPIIRGWANYHRHVVAKDIFTSIHSYTIRRLWQWARRRHPNKNKKWVKNKYFQSIKGDNWVFFGVQDGQKCTLYDMGSTKIIRHTKIKGKANPYDPQWEMYFEKRTDGQMLRDLKSHKLKNIWKSQNGKCPICGEKITKESGWHTHHIIPKHKGGNNSVDNLIMLHPNCHRKVHSQNLKVVKPVSKKT